MKLKEGFITQDVDDTQFMVPVGANSFSGFLRSNETAAFIVNYLKEETTEDKILEAMLQEYDVPKEVASADLGQILNVLREIDALEEQ